MRTNKIKFNWQEKGMMAIPCLFLFVVILLTIFYFLPFDSKLDRQVANTMQIFDVYSPFSEGLSYIIPVRAQERNEQLSIPYNYQDFEIKNNINLWMHKISGKVNEINLDFATAKAAKETAARPNFQRKVSGISFDFLKN